MSYCTTEDLTTRFGEAEIIQLSDRARTGEIGQEVVDLAVADATAEIDSRLGGRFIIPDPTPADLVRRASDIARFMLYDDRVTDEVRSRYEEAIAWLKDVAAGRAVIAGALPANDGEAGGGIAVSSSDLIFTDELLARMG
jgi:phage gp36-like protein